MAPTRRRLLVLAAALSAFPATAALASADEATAFVRQMQAELARAAPPGRDGDAAAVERIVNRAFDLETIARATLGSHAAAATPAQVRRLARVFALRMTRETLRRRKSATGTSKIVRTTPAAAGEWLVYTQTNQDRQQPVVAAWRVRKGPRGLKIVDVLRDGASIVSAQRRDIQTALRGNSLDGVITKMEQRYAKPSG